MPPRSESDLPLTLVSSAVLCMGAYYFHSRSSQQNNGQSSPAAQPNDGMGAVADLLKQLLEQQSQLLEQQAQPNDGMGAVADLLKQLLEQQSQLLGQQSQLLEQQSKPEKVVSGSYYAVIDDIFNFQLQPLSGRAFTDDYQRENCPDYIVAILRQRILTEGIDLPILENIGVTTNGTTSGQHFTFGDGLTPRSSNGGSGVGRSSSSLSQHSSRTSRTSGTSSTRSKNSKGNGDGAETNDHIFGGKTKPSKAHLWPPKNPVCQEFYDDPASLGLICGNLENFDLFQSLQEKVGEREAIMVLVRALADLRENKIFLPELHAPFYDEDLDKGTLLIIPIMSLQAAVNWNKGEPYSVLVIADSVRTYNFCNMDYMKLPLTASPSDLTIATSFVTECIHSLGYSLMNHKFDALSDDLDREDRYKPGGKGSPEQKKASFQSKANTTLILQKLINENGYKVLAPEPKREYNDGSSKIPRLLKIDFGDIANCRIPHPLMLGKKAGICMHKYAATANPNAYQAKNRNVQEYTKMKGSMMLRPACGDPSKISVQTWAEDDEMSDLKTLESSVADSSDASDESSTDSMGTTVGEKKVWNLPAVIRIPRGYSNT